MAERFVLFKTFSQITDARWYPRYHIAAPHGWSNDPNGLCFYNGQYHFFYQHYPYEPQWGSMHWGHVISEDLAYWKHLPIALKPDKPYEEGGGCFSGSAIEKDGNLWLMYTGHSNVECQCLAYSEDGIHFKKFAGNPVIKDENIDTEEIYLADIRDPKVWMHDGRYYTVVGSRTPDKKHGQILLFESEDLFNWNFKAISARSDGTLGEMWECPNFVEIDGQDVLIFSPMNLDTSNGKFYHDKAAGVLIGKLNYTTGIFEHGDFQYLDKGFDFYAPQVMQTPDGRAIIIGWLATWFVEMHEAADGWAGQMTVPRELHVKNGKIISTPIKELEKLRKWKKISYENLQLSEPTKLDGISGEAFELLLTIDVVKSKKFSIALRTSEDERTLLSYAEGIFKLDRTYSGKVIHKINPKTQTIIGVFDTVREIQINSNDKLKLHIFIDRSSMEIFINDGEEVLSAKIYPNRSSQEIIFLPDDEVFAIDDVTYYKLDFGLPHPHIKDDNKRENPFSFLKSL